MAIRTRRHITTAVCGLVLAGALSAQSGVSCTAPVAPPRWASTDTQPVQRYAVSDDGTVVLVLRSSDTSIVMLDSETGAETMRLRGSRAPYGFQVSPDGLRCMVTEFTVDDSTETSRLYDMFTGQQVWARREKAGVLALSTRLQRGMVFVTKTSPSFTTTHELRDLETGDSIRTFSDAPISAFIDESHQRIYLASTNWHGVEGAQGGWIVELDAFTGQELRSWQPSTYGPMCRLADSDTLLVAGYDAERPFGAFMKIIAIDLNSGRERDVVSCSTATDEYGCIQFGFPPKWAFVDMEHHHAYMHGVISALAPSPLMVMFRNQCTPTARIMLQSENIKWENIPLGSNFNHVSDYFHEKLYYVPEGLGFARHPLVCHPITFTVDVPEVPERIETLRLHLDDGMLRVMLPEGLTSDATIDVMDMQGRLLRQVRTDRTARTADVALDGLASGAYLCSFAAGERRSLGRFNVIR